MGEGEQREAAGRLTTEHEGPVVGFVTAGVVNRAGKLLDDEQPVTANGRLIADHRLVGVVIGDATIDETDKLEVNFD